MQQEQWVRDKSKNIKPASRLLQNDVKGRTRIPMTSSLRQSLEQVRQRQKYVILEQERERIAREK